MRYRAEIDGLRALAVVPVILYHAGFLWIPGGFVGVDVFFVISGYLITSILMTDLENSRFSIITFYERRARRILPALFAMIILVMPLAYCYLLPGDTINFWKSVLAVCFFVSNYLFLSLTGYFSPDVDLMPLLHTWSLAVEEQFYIFFPLILFCLWRLGTRAIIFFLALIGGVSFYYADIGSISEPTFTFYSITTRSWELILGAFAAIYFRSDCQIHKQRIIASLLGSCGIGAIIFSMLYITGSTPYPGRYALLPTLGAFLVIIFCSETNFPGRILSLKPMVGIGLISYSAYLWHQPLMAIVRHKYIIEPSINVMMCVILITMLLAYLSWRFIEKPFRGKGNITRLQIFTYAGVGTSLFVTIAIIGVKTPYLNRFEGSEIYNSSVYRLRGNFGLSQQCE
ncbi:acyltransferase family protein, partial [Trabulsiella odontotermitis]